jgi:hypothetical protein
VYRIGDDSGGRADLDDLAEVHDGNSVAHVSHDGQVVGDEETGDAEALLERPEQIEHLGLNGNVECGNGLVADNEIGFDSERPRDTDTLALPAAELVGVAARVFGPQADDVEQLVDALCAASTGERVNVEDLRDGIAHGQPGIQ